MKEAVHWLLSQNHSSLTIGLFDIWHFVYLAICIGGPALLAALMNKKSDEVKDKIVRVFAYLTIGIYIADFFLMPLSDSYDGIAIHKLPFHICTLMGVMGAFVQFNPRLSAIKTPVVVMAVASSLMWMCYPGSALGGQPPFSYVIFQTFMYHGLLFGWGLLNLAWGGVTLRWKEIWKEFVGVLILLVWSGFGNAIYDEQNWFFTKQSIFPFLPDEVMPPVVVFCVFGTCFLVYCGYFGIRALIQKRNKKLTTV
ncbi:MAG: YwaF family protein [Clostridia bacterium]|nr:YwaF family protein [Clostridia bacterium]